MATTEPIRNPKDVKRLADFFKEKGEYRNHALIVLGVCTALRVGDLLSLRWTDVYDFRNERYKTHIRLTEHKTGKKKSIAINKQVREALALCFPHRNGGEFIFAGKRGDKPLCRQQAYHIVRNGAKAVGIEGVISPHSLRKTFGYRAHAKKVSPTLLIQIYQHTDYATTERYLGITQDEIDKVYMDLDLF